jgi:hypothetical protein
MADQWGTYLFDLGEEFNPMAAQIDPGLRGRLTNRTLIEAREGLDIGAELVLHLDGELRN